MREFKKSKEYKFWYSPLVLVALFCVVAVFAYNMIGLIEKERETAKNKEVELQKIDELRKREEALSTDIAKLGTDQGKEEVIRDKFQVVKPGEKMVVIVDDQDNKTVADESPKDHSFWGFIKRMFSHQ
jgi:cell division protein FtsB